jgi:hypothetical protein
MEGDYKIIQRLQVNENMLAIPLDYPHIIKYYYIDFSRIRAESAMVRDTTDNSVNSEYVDISELAVSTWTSVSEQ